MVHADAALLPDSIQSSAQFYAHLEEQLEGLLSDQRAWVSNLSNASSLIYFSLNAWKSSPKSQSVHVNGSSNGNSASSNGHGNFAPKKINWAGFYLLSPLIPGAATQKRPTLLLGPFVGLPACQAIPSIAGKGVCADASAILPPRTVRVQDTDAYPGHIACDSASKSEIVLPLVIPRSALSGHSLEDRADQWGASRVNTKSDDDIIIGVLDIDCEELDGFDEEDQKGLERIATLIARSSDW
ncbi:GAF/PUTATIVE CYTOSKELETAL PROTEIN [Ceraceosorus bombacis]|uniref:GAF/PUTATIVE CYTOSKELETAL PROTEIN n=1 Tax=Ceraceosorus bombacis TaxID=401625 RepID=A0A0P1BID7_9BASI|nr:GAF/PUTATIVE CYTOSKELETAL PROTEIN [Ceraceosorus bombacis]